jgi:hypothetical protein
MLLTIENKIKESPDLTDNESELDSEDSEFWYEPPNEEPTILKVEPARRADDKGTANENMKRIKYFC